MYSSARRLEEVFPSLKLAVATVYSGKSYQKVVIDGVTYYLLPLKGKNMQKYHRHLELFWRETTQDFQPDLVHLHGTEFPHGLAFLNANPNVKALVSIQGLVSVCARYYLADIHWWDILKSITFRDIVRFDNLWQQRRNFAVRGKYEQAIIRRSGNVIGRTSWDWAHACSIEPNINYYFCNETLRDEFYYHTWRYDKCEKHSLFLSQASYPLKGLHKVLMALPLVKKVYPDVKVYIGGIDIRGVDSLNSRLRRSGYGQYILYMIRKMHLAENVYFLGTLSEKQICERYLKANIFICPSSIENSPNSLGEAQLLGVPCIASYVGGVPDMMVGYNRGAVYRFEEVEMLACEIIKMFSIEHYTDESASAVAHLRHDKIKNAERMIEIYKDVISKK